MNEQINLKRCHSMNTESSQSMDDRESLKKEDIINGFVVKDA